MPIVSVKHVPIGATLAEEVRTPLGGLLFPKGTVIHEKDLEFLEAFKISEVVLENEEKTQLLETATSENQSEKKDEDSFDRAFDEAVKTFRNIMLRVQRGNNVPVIEVRRIVESLLVHVKNKSNILQFLRKSFRLHTYQYEHSLSVGLLSYVIAKWMRIPENEWMQIALAGTLSDIGKVKIEPTLLLKPGELTEKEYAEVKQHTIYGYELLKGAAGLNEGAALVALQHHEREDGSGYPLGLTGSKIHLYSKIVAVADVFHAMCSNRAYRKASSPFLVVEHLLQESYGKLDTAVVNTFVNGITQFAAGTIVELSDGTIGKIILTDRNHPTRPLVEANGRLINLAELRHLYIQSVV